MKLIVGGVSALAVGLFTTAALADGMTSPKGMAVDAVASPSACAAAKWAGNYAGVQIGTASYKSQMTLENVLGLSTEHDKTGIMAGGTIGRNWSRCNTVMGIEADWAKTDVDAKYGIDISSLVGGPVPPFFEGHSKMSSYGTLRGRSGVAFDNMLLYVTGGLAFADIKHTGANAGFLLPLSSFSTSGIRWGEVVGAGVEYALTDRISFKSEGLYTHFQDKSFNYNLTPVNALALKAHDDVWTFRAGLNFKLGGERASEAAPLK